MGFVFNIDSLLLFGREILFGREPVKYFMTYRLSQDHLETFFSAVRLRGGWNNNPSALQFSHAYKALLSNAGMATFSFENANCIPQGESSILCIQKPFVSFEEDPLFISDFSGVNLNPFEEGIVTYISGWVVRKIVSKIDCSTCQHSLIRKASACPSGLLRIKNNGGLVVPSEDVVKVVNVCEKLIRINSFSTKLQNVNYEAVFVSNVISNIPSNVFAHLEEHYIETSVGLDNHYYHLLKIICKEFVKLRRNHIVKIHNSSLKAKSVRQKLTKEILFRNQ